MSQSTSRWSNLCHFCSAIREVVIVMAMLSLLIVPSVVGGVLVKVGIRSGADVEFDVENIAQSRDDLDST